MKKLQRFWMAVAFVGFVVTPLANAGTIGSKPFTSDATSGIGTFGQGAGTDSGFAVDVNGPTITINGVSFQTSPQSPHTAQFESAPTSITGTISGVTYTLTGTPNAVFGNTNGNNLTGNSATLGTNFFYSNGGTTESLALTGLTPNTSYTFVEYTIGYGNAGGRIQTVTDSQGGNATFDENGAGNGNGQLLKDVYTTGAGVTSMTFTFHDQDGSDTMHQYAFTNFTPEPASLGGFAIGSICLLARRRAR